MSEEGERRGRTLADGIRTTPFSCTTLHTWLRRYPPKIRWIGVVSDSLFGSDAFTPRRVRKLPAILSNRCLRNSWASSYSQHVNVMVGVRSDRSVSSFMKNKKRQKMHNDRLDTYIHAYIRGPIRLWVLNLLSSHEL